MPDVTAKFASAALLVIAMAFVSSGVVRAAGPFDGNWVLNASGSGGRAIQEGGQQTCSDFRIPFQITNSQISGNFSRSPSNPSEIVASPSGSPMKGSVQPDGTLDLQWEAYKVTGKITGNALVATWTGQCGQRSATGTKVQ